jgi:hypothetical protein
MLVLQLNLSRYGAQQNSLARALKPFEFLLEHRVDVFPRPLLGDFLDVLCVVLAYSRRARERNRRSRALPEL